MPRILILSSHVGLGHVARDLAVARALRRTAPRITIDWCSAEPVNSFLDEHGERVVDECRGLWSLSTLIEDLYNRGWSALGGVKGVSERLAMLRRNWKTVEQVLEGYDLVLADEFWELLYAAPKEARNGVVFATDLVYKPYKLNPLDALISYLLNRFFRERFSEVGTLVYLNEPDMVSNRRWLPLVGGKVGDWLKEHAVVLGLATSYLPWELPTPDEARRRLSVDQDTMLVSVSIGGTGTRSTVLLNCIASSTEGLERLARNQGYRDLLVKIVLGPRTLWEPPRGLEGVIEVTGTVGSMVDYYVASDLLVTRGGRTTTADMVCAGRPAVLVPIRGHFEQEEIAGHMERKYGYPVILEGSCSPRVVIRAAERALRLRPPVRRPERCNASLKLARLLAEIMGQEGGGGRKAPRIM